MIQKLEHHLADILSKNMLYTAGPCILLFDVESPLAALLAQAYDAVLPTDAVRTKFIQEEQESITKSLFDLPKWSLVILVQSTSFRLSDFRIRLELFHRGIDVLEHNHLGYIPEEQFATFIDSLAYHTPEYLDTAKHIEEAITEWSSGKLIMQSWNELTFGPLERPRANSGDYSQSENRGGTFPIGEVFSECQDLESMSGSVDIFGYPDTNFGMVTGETFTVQIQNGRLIRATGYPADFDLLLDKIVATEGEIWVREIGIGLNRAISRSKPLSDVNYFERQFWVHLSLGKKHGIYGKKLPKEEVQRYHIDVFLDAKSLQIGGFEMQFV